MPESIAQLLKQAIKERVFPGCAVAIIEKGEVVKQAFGQFTYDNDSPHVENSTLFDCASLSKVVGPMALAMMLVDEGVLNLAEKIGTYLPEFNTQTYKEHTCLYHLMTYTLDYDIPGGSKSILGNLSAEQVAKNAMSLPLKAEPGTNYMYSNITAFILTQVIERVTGKNFNTLVHERIFTPLKMKTATFEPTVSMQESIPPTELTDDRGLVQGFVHDEFTYHTTKGGIRNGAAGLFASIDDLTHFLQMTLERGIYCGHRLFNVEAVSLWTTDYLPELLPTHSPLMWGDQNNVLIDSYHQEMVVKSGFTGCFMAVDLKQQKGFVLLSNRIYPKRPADASAFAVIKETLMQTVFRSE